MKNFIKGFIALIIGHLTVFKHNFKKSVTLEYPEKKKVLNENFRGEHALALKEDGTPICGGCGLCKKVCPANAIEITKDENNKLIGYTIDLGKCIFCGNCVQNCPNKAILMSKNFELATDKKSSLKLDINTLKNNYIVNIIGKRG